jgi:hypothetical protein
LATKPFVRYLQVLTSTEMNATMQFGTYEMTNFTEMERRFLAHNLVVQDIIWDDLQMKLGWVRWHWDFQMGAWMEDDELLPACEWAFFPDDVRCIDLVLANSFFAE